MNNNNQRDLSPPEEDDDQPEGVQRAPHIAGNGQVAGAIGGDVVEGEEAEDEAPESVQGQQSSSNQGHHQQRLMFPDLLARVDDPPEGQGSLSRNRPACSATVSSPSCTAGNPLSSMGVNVLQRRPAPSGHQQVRPQIHTGTIPKRQPPDSGSTPPDLTSAGSRNPPTSSSASSSSLSHLPSNGHNHHQPSSSTSSSPILHLESSTSQLTQIQSQLTIISNAVSTLNRSFQVFADNVNRQLNQLDTRITSLQGQAAIQGSSGGSSSVQLDTQTVDAIRSLIRQQRDELSSERTSFLVTLSDALRVAASSSDKSIDEKRPNGPS